MLKDDKTFEEPVVEERKVIEGRGRGEGDEKEVTRWPERTVYLLVRKKREEHAWQFRELALPVSSLHWLKADWVRVCSSGRYRGRRGYHLGCSEGAVRGMRS
jgi:hypothetical protein